MPWTIGTFHKKKWYHSPWPWIAAAALVSGALILLPHAQDYYRAWRQSRRVAQAEKAFAEGDLKSAVLHARTALIRDRHSVPAARVFARALEASGSPEALAARQHLETIGGNDAENSLAIAAAMWKAKNYEATARALKETPEAGKKDARFHELSARLAQRSKNHQLAVQHWVSALEIAPGNADFAIELSTSQLQTGLDQDRAAALAKLADLCRTPASAAAARRILLADALSRKEASRSLELADELANATEAPFADKVRRLSVLKQFRREEANSYLGELQKEAAATARDVFLLLTWMNENGLALAIPEWRQQLPAESLDMPQIRSVLAEAEARASNWSFLHSSLQQENWKELDFLRFAYVARAAERLGDETSATAAWSNTLTAAGSQPWSLEVLARTILPWGWAEKSEAVLVKLIETGRAPRWAADQLWKSALGEQNSGHLYLAARAIATLDPRSIPARNNYIALALLTGKTADDPHKLAATLFQQAPTDAVVATTYGLSLFQQGRAAEAVVVMKTFPKEKLREPNIALYHAVFLTGAGRLAEAREYLPYAARARMLPEERALFAQAGGDTTAAAGTGRALR